MAKQQTVISHWYQLIESFQTSPLAFYQSVEAAIERREVPELSTARIEFKEGGVLTANREYLRIVRGKYSFDICGAPFGTGFFFSWWLTELPPAYGVLYLLGLLFLINILVVIFFQAGVFIGILFTFVGIPFLLWLLGYAIRQGIVDLEDIVLATPVVGWLYEKIFAPPTYYRIDTALMFQQAVHNAVLEIIDQMTAAKGVRALSELERKPILKGFAQAA